MYFTFASSPLGRTPFSSACSILTESSAGISLDWTCGSLSGMTGRSTSIIDIGSVLIIDMIDFWMWNDFGFHVKLMKYIFDHQWRASLCDLNMLSNHWFHDSNQSWVMVLSGEIFLPNHESWSDQVRFSLTQSDVSEITVQSGTFELETI